MGITPIFKYFYPEDSTPNDLRLFFSRLAGQIETEQSLQGTFEDRPGVGVRGRLYFATTRRAPHDGLTVVTWNVLYRDTGSAWVQLNRSAWVDMAPIGMQVEGGPSPHVTMDSKSYCRYRTGQATVQFKFQALVHVTSPIGYTYGIVAPILPKWQGETGGCVVQNIPGLSQTDLTTKTAGTSATGAITLVKSSLNLNVVNTSIPATNAIGNVADGNGFDTYNGNLHLGSADTYDRFNIEYEI